MSKYGLANKNGRDIVIVMLLFGVIAFISTAFRLWSKSIKKLGMQWDDVLMIGATCLMISEIGLVTATVTNGGVGYHVGTEVPITDVMYVLKLIIPCQGIYGICLGMVKTALMLVYLRIFGPNQHIRLVVYIVMVIVWGWAFSIFIESFVLCTPFPANWNPTIPSQCGNRIAAFVAAGALNMVTDIMVLTIPIPYIWKLKMKTAKKIGLIFIFCLGLFVSAVSIVRMKALIGLSLADATYSLPIPLMWSVVEPELAIICANLPLLRPVLSRLGGRFFDSTRGASEYPTDHSGLASANARKKFQRLEGSGTHSNESQERCVTPHSQYELELVPAEAKSHWNVNVDPERQAGASQCEWTRPKLCSKSNQASSKESSSSTSPPKGIMVQQDFNVHYK